MSRPETEVEAGVAALVDGEKTLIQDDPPPTSQVFGELLSF